VAIVTKNSEVQNTAKKLPWSAKTGIEADAAERAFRADYDEYGSSQGAYDDNRRHKRLDSAMQQARNEVKRETRGKAPAAYKKGGMVSASKRADGCAQRGKTKGRML
jgi:hypothetical protein